MFPDPEEFNPLRWLEPEYPTYQEPLTQYPTIMNMTQFGYGKRTCQGQAVTEADLIVGIGALAWLFDVGKVEKVRRIMKNEAASISQEELITGMSEHSSDDDSETEDDMPLTPIGRFPESHPDELREQYIKELEKLQAKQRQQDLEADPTLNFTTLLIAKPMPFKFSLSIRDEKRAEKIHQLFAEKMAEGEFKEATDYCKSSPRTKSAGEHYLTEFPGGPYDEKKEFGWVKV
jgi:hypothetical protein